MEIDEYSHIHVINPISYHDVTYPSYKLFHAQQIFGLTNFMLLTEDDLVDISVLC